MITQADNIFVSNAGNGTIEQFDSSGNETIFASGLNDPAGLAFDSSGNLYVASCSDGTILRYDSTGGETVFAAGLSNPTGLACDLNGNLYAANRTSIVKISPGGNQSIFAANLNLNSDAVYLATDCNGNVYANTYSTLIKFNFAGNGPSIDGQRLQVIEGMACDAAGDLFVCQQNSGSIQQYFGTGGPNTSYTSYPGYSGSNDYRSVDDQPLDAAFDSAGNLYATFRIFNSPGHSTYLSGVIMEFNLDGTDSILATDTGGQYIAVQPVPEPGVFGLLILGGVFFGWKLARQRNRVTGSAGRGRMICSPLPPMDWSASSSR